MLGIVFATLMEASPFLKQSAAVQINHKKLLFISPKGKRPLFTVMISGMGKVAAALAAQELILNHNADLLINAGICGALKKGRAYGPEAVFRIDSAVEGDCDRFGHPASPVFCEAGLFSHMPGARLVTNDRPVFDRQEKRKLSEKGELVDMEGAAVARAAERHRIKWSMIKGISDLADDKGKESLQKNLVIVSEKLAKVLILELETISR